MKDIPEYEQYYAVTKDGQIWSKRKQRYMSLIADRDGYLKVKLSKDGKSKTKYVHRLVLIAYRPIIEYKPVLQYERLQVNHLDFNKSNNKLSNLEWCTEESNRAHAIAGNRQLPTVPDSVVIKIRQDKVSTAKELSIKYNVKMHTVYRILNYTIKPHLKPTQVSQYVNGMKLTRIRPKR